MNKINKDQNPEGMKKAKKQGVYQQLQ